MLKSHLPKQRKVGVFYLKKGKTEQFRIVHHDSLEIYNEQLNDAMRELKDKSPRVEFHQTNPTYAIIRYVEEWEEPETLADEYQLMGIRFTCCDDCNQIEGMDDGRRRRYWCKYKNYIAYGDKACEEFYKKFARGERGWIKEDL